MLLKKYIVFHDALGNVGVNFGSFYELLGEDATEETAGEESEKKKRNHSDNKKGNIDSIRERIERILKFSFPGESQE